MRNGSLEHKQGEGYSLSENSMLYQCLPGQSESQINVNNVKSITAIWPYVDNSELLDGNHISVEYRGNFVKHESDPTPEGNMQATGLYVVTLNDGTEYYLFDLNIAGPYQLTDSIKITAESQDETNLESAHRDYKITIE